MPIGGLPLLVAAAGEKLPPPTRAAVFMALLGIALLGLLIIVMILLGGHWVRRQGRFRRGPAVPPDRLPLKPQSGGRGDLSAAGDPPTRRGDTTRGDGELSGETVTT